jgi:hypothetical protein
LNNRISLPAIIAPPPSVSSFVRPIRNPLPGPVATGSAPRPPAGFNWLLYVNYLIVKDKLALFGQIWAQRQTHNGAQFCTIPPSRAQLESNHRRQSMPHRRKILETRFPSSQPAAVCGGLS